MTRENLEEQLENLGFSQDVSHEYHNDVFTTSAYPYRDMCLSIEAYVDRYNLKLIWRYSDGKRVGKNFYMSKEVSDYASAEDLINDFVSFCIDFYKIGA